MSQILGKIIDDHTLELAGSTLYTDENVIYNPTEEQLLENGYKKVISNFEENTPLSGKHYVYKWVDKGDFIEGQVSLEDNEEDESVLSKRIEALEEDQKMMESIFWEVINNG